MSGAQNLYNEATELYGRAKAIMDEFDGKDMPAEKAAELDRLFDAFDKKTEEAESLEKRESKAARAAETMRNIEQPSNRLGTPRGGSTDEKADAEQRAIKAWQKAMSYGPGSLTDAERKDLSATDDTEGGFLRAPSTVAQEFIKFVDDEVVIRQLATVYPLDAGTELVAPSWDADPSDPEWTSEVQSIPRDNGMRTGQRSLKPAQLAKEVLISRRLLRQSRINAEQLVRQRLAYKHAVAQEKAFMTGDGAQKPLGLFVASDQGIGAARDVASGAATTFTGDNLLDTKHSLKAAYWNRPSTRWLLHRDTLARVRKLKDGNGNYLWSPGLGPGGGITSGLPSTIVDVPYVASEFAPNTFTNGNYVALIGDLSFYWIADSLSLEIQVLYELYAKTSQVGYIGRLETDGMPVLAEAFARLKLGA